MKKTFGTLALGALMMAASGCASVEHAQRADHAGFADEMTSEGLKKLTADIMDNIHSTTDAQLSEANAKIIERLRAIEARLSKLEAAAQ